MLYCVFIERVDEKIDLCLPYGLLLHFIFHNIFRAMNENVIARKMNERCFEKCHVVLLSDLQSHLFLHVCVVDIINYYLCLHIVAVQFVCIITICFLNTLMIYVTVVVVIVAVHI